MMTPTDVHCVRATVTGPITVVRTFDTTPGSTKLFSFTGLPVGHVSLFVDAFNPACSSVAATTPATWVAPEAVELDLLPGRLAAVPLRLRPAAGVDVSVDFQGVTPGLFFDAEQIDFGPVPIGTSLRRHVNLYNFTANPFTPTFLFTGEDAEQFSAHFRSFGDPNCRFGQPIPANTGCLVEVFFAPTRQTNVQAIMESGPTLHLVTKGSGAGAQGVTLVPSSIDMGSVSLGNQTLQTMTLTNASFSDYPTSGFISGAGPFDVVGGTCRTISKIPSGGSCTFVVGYAPKTVGMHLAEFQAGTDVRATLRGTGLAAVFLDPPLRNFFSVVVGESREETFTVSNLTGSDAALAPALDPLGASEGFDIHGGTCTATLAAGATCTIIVRFSPIVPRAARGTLTAGAGINVATVTAEGVKSATVSFTPASFDFPKVAVGTSAEQTFVLSNDTMAPFAVAPSFSGGDSAQFRQVGGTCGASLAAGDSCTVVVRFTPTSSGIMRSTLVAGSGPVTAEVSGTGINAGVAVDPNQHGFGNLVPGQFEDFTFTVTNATATTFPVSVFFSGTNASDFKRNGGTCGSSLAASATCTVVARFAPVVSGHKSASMSVGAGATVVALSGDGFDSGVTITPGTFDFGNVQVGGVASHTFTIANSSTMAIPPGVFVLGNNNFTVATGQGTCAGLSTLAAGSSCTFAISFSPASVGVKSGDVGVTNFVATATLSGTGVGAFSSLDIGAVGTGGAGSFTQNGNAFTIKGSGADIWGTADAFFFTFQNVIGDAQITARVSDLQLVNDWTKAGVMMRDGNTPGARNVFALVPANRNNMYRLQRRTTAGGTTTGTAGAVPPVGAWLRLVRRGNDFTAFTSSDGLTFAPLGPTVTMTLPQSLMVGLAVSSHVAGTLAQAIFSNVEIINL
jgi:hypothetical protein